MKLTPIYSDCYVITEAEGLDPIGVQLHDFERGKGRLVVECYGQAWAAYWLGMGGMRLREFIASADADYIAICLQRDSMRRPSKRGMKYLTRIVEAMKSALKQLDLVS